MKCIIKLDIPMNRIDRLVTCKDRKLTESILAFFYNAVEKGYDHFVINITCPLDVWFAEVVYYQKKNRKSIKYSLGFWIYDIEEYKWLNDDNFYFITRDACKVFFRSPHWLDNSYGLIYCIIN